jgi:hypothetical protein
MYDVKPRPLEAKPEPHLPHAARDTQAVRDKKTFTYTDMKVGN